MDELIKTKKCSRCPEGENIKPVSQFFKNKDAKDGLFSWCKTCHAKAEARPERVAKRKAYKAQYHLDHAEAINAKTLKWQKDNPEKANAKNKRSKKKRQAERIAAGEIAAPKKYRNRLESLTAGEKDCSQCEVVKPLSEFYAWAQSPDGVQAECKDCHDGRSRPIYSRDASILEKECSECGITKVSAEFYDNPYVKSGIRAACKTCTDARNIAWAQANPEKRKLIANRSFRRILLDPVKKALIYLRCMQWKARFPERVRLHHERDWAKRKGQPTTAAKRLYNQQWFAARPGYRRAASQRRRALIRQAPILDAYIDIAIVYERGHGICSLCDYPVERALAWPDLECATIEHVVALTKGGAHAYSNTALAHHYCNSLKHNRPLTPELRAWIRILFERRRAEQEAQRLSGQQLALFY